MTALLLVEVPALGRGWACPLESCGVNTHRMMDILIGTPYFEFCWVCMKDKDSDEVDGVIVKVSLGDSVIVKVSMSTSQSTSVWVCSTHLKAGHCGG